MFFLLVSFTNASRNETSPPDRETARENARELFQAGAKAWGTDESVFIRILSALSHAQLGLVFEEYVNASGKSMEETIESEMSGNLKDGMLAIVRCAKSKVDYFATLMYGAMKGAGTDDNALIRLIVSRSEIDMADIKKAFERIYKKPLAESVKDDCGGDYRRILLALIK